MRAVVDTNVLVSGLLSRQGAPAQVVRMVIAGAVVVCYDGRILAEYDEVLHRPEFPSLEPEEVAALLVQIEDRGELVAAQPVSPHLPDPTDEPFLEVAVAARAEYLVTGNLKHYPQRRIGCLRIVSPAEFVEICRERN